MCVILRTNNDGSWLVLWIKGAATAPVFHHDLAHFVSLQRECWRVLETRHKQGKKCPSGAVQLNCTYSKEWATVSSATSSSPTFRESGHFEHTVAASGGKARSSGYCMSTAAVVYCESTPHAPSCCSKRSLMFINRSLKTVIQMQPFGTV